MPPEFVYNYTSCCAHPRRTQIRDLQKKQAAKISGNYPFGDPPGEPRLGSFFLISQNLVYFNCIIIYKPPKKPTLLTDHQQPTHRPA